MRSVLLLCLLLTVARPAAGQTAAPDPVLPGYLRLHSGEKEAAFKHFQALHASDPKSLPKWFGMLFTQEDRLELDRALVPAFERDIAAFLQTAEDRYSRSKADSEALFYLEAGYLLRSTFRLNNDKGVFGAARDAARSKGYGDEYVKRHPEHGDAYFALGLYNYYVDIAPNFVKVLRVLLFLPSGNRAEGLKQLERAGRDGSFFAPLAERALADIYGSLEGRLAEAITIDERLVQRFPGNTDMRFDLAQWCMHPAVEAYDRAAEQYTAVLERSTGSSMEQIVARHQATQEMANLRRSQWRLEDGIALLTPTIDQKPDTPVWVMPNFLLRRANYRALLNDPGAAEDARRVLSDPKMSDWHKGAQAQIAFIDNRRKTNEGVIYASLIPGNRLVIDHKWDEANGVYDRVAAAHPGDWQVRYRRAYLEFLRGNYDAAARGFNEIASSTAQIPAWLKAASMLNLAWTHDIAGRRPEALRLYKRIVDDYENEGAAGSARVGLISPYRR
jgi:tetratricopeptide (TPR) repeat protein